MSRLIISVVGFALLYWVQLSHCGNPVRWEGISSGGKVILNRPEPAGHENGNPSYVCRAMVNDRFKPGKLWLANGTYSCAICDKGHTVTQADKFEMLNFPRGSTSWAPVWDGLPSDAIAAGVQPTGTPAYICRAIIGKDLLVGNCKSDVEACQVAKAGNEELVHENFEVLQVNLYGLTL